MDQWAILESAKRGNALIEAVDQAELDTICVDDNGIITDLASLIYISCATLGVSDGGVIKAITQIAYMLGYKAGTADAALNKPKIQDGGTQWQITQE